MTNTTTQHTLTITDLHASVDDTPILKGVSLTVTQGETHAIMGPNGSGKSTLSQVIFGHPGYTVTGGSVEFDGQDVLALSPDKRAHLGLFLAFQQPHAVPGVQIAALMKQAVNAKRRAADADYTGMKIREYRELLEQSLETLHLDRPFADRYVNDGLSGGEKKKSEILQMLMLAPHIAVLDEIDSGLDVDALKVVAENVQTARNAHNTGLLLITHYPRLLQYLKPDHVHILMDGRIVHSGGPELADRIEQDGYDWLRAESAAAEESTS